MSSTDFGALVSPTITAMDRRGFARGGEAKKPRHLSIIIALPNPMIGALAQALMMRRAAVHGALEAAQRRR